MPEFSEKKGADKKRFFNLENRPQPHDLELERAVLSAMLRDPEVAVNVAIEKLGDNPEVFYSHSHRVIYTAILEINQRDDLKVDLLTLISYLTNNKKLEQIPGGAVFLGDVYNAVPTTVRMDSWCEVVRKNYTLREMINVCSESIAKCYLPEMNVDELIESIEHDIYKVRSKELKSEILDARDLLEAGFHTLVDILNGKIEVGIETGYNDLDKITGGLKNGEMFVLAARPSIGKTSLALNILRNVAFGMKNGRENPDKAKKVAFFSLEMTAEQIARRLLCTEVKVSESSFWDKSFATKDIARMTGAVNKFKDATILIDPTPGLSVDELRAKARLLKMREGIELVIIDYLQLMTAKNRDKDGRQQEVSAISGGIKALAKELKIPVLVLAQLNRDVEKNNSGGRPKLSHLRESGSIEQDADVVAFIHRDRDEAKQDDNDLNLETDLIIEKNRNGRTGVVKLHFISRWMEFVPVEWARVSPNEDAPPKRPAKK